jgi:hypothetical protein
VDPLSTTAATPGNFSASFSCPIATGSTIESWLGSSASLRNEIFPSESAINKASCFHQRKLPFTKKKKKKSKPFSYLVYGAGSDAPSNPIGEAHRFLVCRARRDDVDKRGIFASIPVAKKKSQLI